MSKKRRDMVYALYNGRCAYTGKPLDDQWQVDHITPVYRYRMGLEQGDPHAPENLLPALWIVNHYKRGEDSLEGFRQYMLKFHIRLAKVPKNPKVEKSIRYKAYMWRVADAFDIKPDKPFCGRFWFETCAGVGLFV